MSRRLKFSEESRDKIIEGINLVAKAVSSTMGAMGRNVVIQRVGQAPHITKDGYSVAKEIFNSNPEIDMGCQLMKGVSAKTVEDTGDGTTTATVLAKAIIDAGVEALKSGANPIDLKRGIDLAVKDVVEALDSIAKTVETDEQIRQVATISANNDEELGAIIQNAISKVSREGTITVEESRTFETYVDVVEGMKIHRGMLSAAFVTNKEKDTAVLENPLVFLTDYKVDSIGEILPILNSVPENRAILIVSGEMSGEAVATLAINKLRQGFKVAAVKAPFMSEKRRQTLSDMAVMLGGQVLSESNGHKLEDFTVDMFGACDKIIVEKDSTVFIGGAGSTDSIEELKDNLRALKEGADSKFEEQEISERLALISGGVAVLYVGANSEVEMKEKKDRIDDALGATRAAIEEGIVIGGGFALLACTDALNASTTSNRDMSLGYLGVLSALKTPMYTIMENAGIDGETIEKDLKDFSKPNIGLDVKTGDWCDMFDSGIIDPKKVTRVALENAASVASLVLMTECTIVHAD